MPLDDPDHFAAFICLRGDVDNLALSKEGCFGVCDSQGRNWLCWQADRGSVMAEAKRLLKDLPRMQESLRNQGYFGTGGVHVKIVVANRPEPVTWEEQLEDLREQLGTSLDGHDDEGEEWKRNG